MPQQSAVLGTGPSEPRTKYGPGYAGSVCGEIFSPKSMLLGENTFIYTASDGAWHILFLSYSINMYEIGGIQIGVMYLYGSPSMVLNKEP